ncbi:MAG TPA: efflux RND transporter periplasmic adaptor subunit [Myxococcaceae bacterium]|nr:efflux RND transporter periplasmic adaptor subunit [Myxococcaceae bacterium]
MTAPASRRPLLRPAEETVNDPLEASDRPEKRWLKPAVIAGSLLLVAGGGWALFGRGRAEPKIRYETAQVDRGPIVAKVTATGILSALVTVQVGSQVSGRIAEIHADFNSQVEKGQVIARIDPQLFQAALEQTRANTLAAAASVARAKVEAANAQRQLVRSQTLRQQNLIAQADLDTATATAESAAAQVQAAEAQLAQARAARSQSEVNLRYTEIVAPVSGTVISRSVDVGQTVAASLQTPTLFTIAEDLRRMQVDTSVAEADVGKLQPGMKATFTVDAYPGERFEGTIRQIRNAPQTVQNVVTYDAVIDVSNPELKLKPGMTCNVTVAYANRADALRVPNAALRFRPTPQMLGAAPGAPVKPLPPPVIGERTAYRLEGGKPVPAKLETGVSDGTVTELLGGGLKAGDAVIISAVSPPGSSGAGPSPGGGARPRLRGPGF